SRNDARSNAPLTERPIIDRAEIQVNNHITLDIPLGDVDRYPTIHTFRAQYGLDPGDAEEAMSRFEDTVIELWIQLRHRDDARATRVHQWLESHEVAAARVLRAVENEIQNGHLDVSGEGEGAPEDEAQTDSYDTAN